MIKIPQKSHCNAVVICVLLQAMTTFCVIKKAIEMLWPEQKKIIS